MFTNFHQIWQTAAAINVKQCVLKLFTSPDVCTHTLPCNVARDRIVTKYCNFISFQQKCTQTLRQKQLFD